MKYRIIEKEWERILITSDGDLSEIRSVDEIEKGDGRQTTIEMYNTPFDVDWAANLMDVLSRPLEDLPKYLNHQDDIVQGVVRNRLAGEAVESFEYYLFEWFGENALIYHEDSVKGYLDPAHIQFILDEVAPAVAERDDTIMLDLFK